MPENKIITFTIPCYNSAGYMDHCIQSILDGADGADDIEVIIVDDGSEKDDTPAKADAWAESNPSVIKAVHQENGGHGMAVLAGLENASGTFMKVVDSDDWLDADALRRLLVRLRQSEEHQERVDLFITNYVYEYDSKGKHKSQVIKYTHVLPKERVFWWDEIGRFPPTQNLLMHALCYRTSVLRDGGIPMPSHTFYVDNIYAWVPLPRCKRMCYLNLDLYRYFIGREDQSVNEKVMAGRIDQQRRITRIMMESYHLYEDVKVPALRRYMVNYFILMMAICSIFSKLSEQPDAMTELERLWNDLHDYDYKLWKKCRKGIIGIGANLSGKHGEKMTIGLYHLAGKIVKFN